MKPQILVTTFTSSFPVEQGARSATAKPRQWFPAALAFLAEVFDGGR